MIAQPPPNIVTLLQAAMLALPTSSVLIVWAFLHQLRMGKLHKRITGTTLQIQRARILLANPLCLHCAVRGLVTVAVEVDHIVCLAQGGGNDDGNMQGLCHQCHADKTASEQGYRVRKATGLDGWPAAK